MLRAMNTAFSAALGFAPLSLVVALVWRPKHLLQPLPRPVAEPMRWGGLAAAACIWIAIAVIPQRELANTLAVERLIAGDRAREALDFLALRLPGEFAPARQLAPKPFEHSVFTEVPACFSVVQSSDPTWVRALLMSRLDAMVSHLRGRAWQRHAGAISPPRTEQIRHVLFGLAEHGPEADGVLKLVEGLQRLPEGNAWLETNSVFIEALWELATDSEVRQRSDFKTEAEQQADWLALSNRLSSRFLTNVTMVSTNKSSVPTALPPP